MINIEKHQNYIDDLIYIKNKIKIKYEKKNTNIRRIY